MDFVTSVIALIIMAVIARLMGEMLIELITGIFEAAETNRENRKRMEEIKREGEKKDVD